MPNDLPLPDAEWLDRCARRIAERDTAMAPDEVRDLALALHAFERTRALAPEAAVDFVAAELDRDAPRFERRLGAR